MNEPVPFPVRTPRTHHTIVRVSRKARRLDTLTMVWYPRRSSQEGTGFVAAQRMAGRETSKPRPSKYNARLLAVRHGLTGPTQVNRTCLNAMREFGKLNYSLPACSVVSGLALP